MYIWFGYRWIFNLILLPVVIFNLHSATLWHIAIIDTYDPIAEIAKAIGKDAQYVRVGLQQGILKFGCVLKLENSNEFNYYCPDRKVWEETGYFRPVDMAV